MKACEKGRWLGLLLAAVMLLTGLYYVGKADVFFQSSGSLSGPSHLWESKHLSLEVPVNAEELSPIRVLSRISQGIGRFHERLSIRTTSCLVSMPLWPENTPYFAGMTGLQAEPCALLSNAIVRYIHRQDGEKD